MTEFVGWRLCLIVFKTLSDRSRIRTHAHTRVPEFSTEEFLESGSLDLRPSCLVYVDTFFFRFVAFPLGNFFNSEMQSAKRFVSPFPKVLRFNPRVLSFFKCLGWLSSYFCTYKPLGCRSRMTLRFFCFFLLWTVIFNWRSSVTEFVGWRLCLIVFETFSDRSGIRTHAHTRVPEFSTEEFLGSCALDRSAILPGLRRHFFCMICAFSIG